MISAVVSARLAGLDRIKSGFTSRFANRLPIFGASRLPRSFNGRSLSGNAMSSQLDFACRMRNSVFMPHSLLLSLAAPRAGTNQRLTPRPKLGSGNHRYSIATFWPSINAASFKPRWNAATVCPESRADLLLRNPMTGTTDCARAASGRSAAECGQQFSPFDGDCHTPLPREVRKRKDTTPSPCSLPVQGGQDAGCVHLGGRLQLLPPPALGERRHRGLARLRIAVRGACDFSWISRLAKDQQQPPQALANADHGKAACATLLPKPDLPKPVSHKASAVANRLLSRERGCGCRQLCCGLTVENSVVLPRTARPSNPLGYNAGAERASHAIDVHNRPRPPPIRDRQCVFLHEQR